jgi:RNA polymerase sigma-70 factor (ECF subfamily)
MLGSVQDAEDAMQDALLAAWQGLGGFDGRTYRLVPTRANGQLAFGAYLREPGSPQANSLLVLTLSGDRIQAMTRFTSRVLPRFGLPPA